MGDWTDGYVGDIEYINGCYPEQAPARLDLICLLCGVEPPRAPGAAPAFDYCEIGCGNGTTLAALAAANPEGRFVGIDFLPAHIARAEDARLRAQQDNLSFVEADILALADDPGSRFPQFDYITLHGVFSWVSSEVQAGIVRFLARYLKPGGAAYVSYNALPGWTPIMPMQRLLFEYASGVQGDSVERVRQSVDFLRKATEAQSRILPRDAVDTLFSTDVTNLLPDDRLAYLAHEFLNARWQPLYHRDVARHMAEAKLTFVGTATPVENIGGVGLSDAQREVVDVLPDGPFRDTTKDYFNNRMFRRDIYVRGRRRFDAEVREARLREVMLAPCGIRPKEDVKFDVLSSSLTLPLASYDPIFDALYSQPCAAGELVDIAASADRAMTATEVISILTGMDLAMPILRDVTTAGIQSAYRHNRSVAQAAFGMTRQLRSGLAVPVGHSARTIGSVEAAVLDGLFRGLPAQVEPLTAHVLDVSGTAPEEVRGKQVALDPPQLDAPQAEAAGDPAAPGKGAEGSEGRWRDDPSRPMGERITLAVTGIVEETLPVWRQLGIVDDSMAQPPR